MFIRCPKCKARISFTPERKQGRARCLNCGHAYQIGPLEELGATPTERSQRAEQYARENGIDIASAYAVLLGVFPLDDAVTVGTRAR